MIVDKNKGFGFVEYEEEEDCAAALENMHGSELFGKVLRCAIAKPMMNRSIGTAVWTAEDWIQNNLANSGEEEFGADDIVEAASLKPTEWASLFPSGFILLAVYLIGDKIF